MRDRYWFLIEATFFVVLQFVLFLFGILNIWNLIGGSIGSVFGVILGFVFRLRFKRLIDRPTFQIILVVLFFQWLGILLRFYRIFGVAEHLFWILCFAVGGVLKIWQGHQKRHGRER